MVLTVATPSVAPPRSSQRGRGLASRRKVVGLIFAVPAAAMILTFFVWPLVQTIGISFFDWPLLGPKKFIGVDNYVHAFTDPAFLSAAGFTLFYTVLVTPLLLIVALVLVAIVQRGTRSARFFQSIFFLPVCIGFASASYVFLYMFQQGIGPTSTLLNDLGLVSPKTNLFGSEGTALTVVLIMVTWKVAGLQMLLLLSGVQSIPAEINEAAKVDGASRRQVFRLITLPLLRPTLALVLVFSVAGSLLAFDQFYIMTSGGPANSTITAVYQIYRTSFINFDVGYGSTQSILLMVVLAAISAGQLLLLRNTDNS